MWLVPAPGQGFPWERGISFSFSFSLRTARGLSAAGLVQPTAVDTQPTAVGRGPTAGTRRLGLCGGSIVPGGRQFCFFLVFRTALRPGVHAGEAVACIAGPQWAVLVRAGIGDDHGSPQALPGTRAPASAQAPGQGSSPRPKGCRLTPPPPHPVACALSIGAKRVLTTGSCPGVSLLGQLLPVDRASRVMPS